MDKDTLIKIRSWYEATYNKMESSSEYRKARWYLQERIRVMNLLLLKSEEKDYLKKLDCLFLLNTSEGEEKEDFADFIEYE